jgi:hypothetical protein
MDRTNHYERAFEAYLQEDRLCYVAIDETRRSLHDDVSLKSLDFIVYGDNDSRLLVDVKGRRFPGGTPGHERRVWENWSSLDDISGLERWSSLFGPGYQGLLVFSYCVAADLELPLELSDIWHWRGRRYLFRAVEVSGYKRAMRRRSPKWGTVCLPRADFRRLARPLHHFTHGFQFVTQECPF